MESFMTGNALISKMLLGTVLCCGISQLSVAQRPAPEPPLAPVQPRVQKPVPVVPLLADNDTKPTAEPPWVASPRPQPLFLLNAEVIISPDGVSPAQIKKIMVYKGQDAPAQWRELVTYGIIDVTPKQKIKLKSRTLASIGKDFNLSELVRYTVNAMPVANANLRIALDAIDEIRVTRATPETPLLPLLSASGR